MQVNAPPKLSRGEHSMAPAPRLGFLPEMDGLLDRLIADMVLQRGVDPNRVDLIAKKIMRGADEKRMAGAARSVMPCGVSDMRRWVVEPAFKTRPGRARGKV